MGKPGTTAIDTEIPWGIEILSDEDCLIAFRWNARNTHQNPLKYRLIYGAYYLFALFVLLFIVGTILHGLLIDFNSLQVATGLLLGLPLCLGLYLHACRWFFPLVQEVTVSLDPGELHLERSVFGITLPTLTLKNAGQDDWNLDLTEGKRFRDFELNTTGWKEEKTVQIHANEKQARWIHHLISNVL